MDEAWLDSLSQDNRPLAAQGEIHLAGLLVSAPNGRICLLVGSLYLEFNIGDVIEIQEIPDLSEVRFRSALAVDVKLRSGAALMAVHNSATLPLSILGGPKPFALATRSSSLMLPQSSTYKSAESDYLRRHGLVPES